MKFRFFDQHRDALPIRVMYRVLDVSPSGYYAWRRRPESPRAAETRQLVSDVRRIHAHHHSHYGSPCMRLGLAEGGIRLEDIIYVEG